MAILISDTVGFGARKSHQIQKGKAYNDKDVN